MITLRNPTVVLHSRKVTELASRYRLPSMYDDWVFVEQGGLLSYGADLADLYRRAAT